MRLIKLPGLALVSTAALALAATSASAADLGGNCCADLEERIAELEATTARKGNRKVSLTVSGQVNVGVLFFDDGVETNGYIVDNDNTSSRFRFLGSAKIDTNWSAGYVLEIETEVASSNLVTQTNDDPNSTLGIRQSHWYLDHKQLGRVTVGQASPATDDIILADSAGIGAATISDPLIGNSLFFRNAAGALTNLSVNTLSGGSFDTARGNLVRYDTPTLAGFRVTATWGEDDFWDVAVWYAGKVGDFKIVGGVGYLENTDASGTAGTGDAVGTGGLGQLLDGESFDEIKGSISILHEPTGLFGSFAYVNREFDILADNVSGRTAGSAAALRQGVEYYYFNAGIVLPKLLPAGKTVLYGEYGQADGVGSLVDGSAAAGVQQITDANLDIWGLGFVQHIPAAEMEVFATYKNFDIDARTATTTINTDQIDIVFTGARIKF